MVLLASPPSSVLCGFLFSCLSGVCLLCPLPPPQLVVVSSVVLCRASCRVVLWSVVCSVFCPVLCGLLVPGWVLAPRSSARCCAGSCRALLRSLLVFFLRCSLPLRGDPGCFCFFALFLRCCAGVPASLPSVRCSLAHAELAGALLPVVFACLLLGLAVLYCLLGGLGGSCCRVSLVCCVVSLGGVLPCVAARCAAWRCVVVCYVVLFCSVWCCRALCRVHGRCPSSWGPVPFSAVFCLVFPRCVCSAVVCCCVVLFAVVLCALCVLGCPAVRSLSSPPCAVLLCGPALPWCPAPLCCAPWCCGAVWCCGVLSCNLVWFASYVCLVSATPKSKCEASQ